MFWLMPLISGLGTWAATGDFKKGLMSGLLGAGIGGIAGALGGAAGGAKAVADVGTHAAAASNAASAGASALNAAPGVAQGLGQGMAQGVAGAVPHGMGALMQGASNPALAAAAKPGGGVVQAGIDFLRRKPVTSGLMVSALSSSLMPPEMQEQEKRKSEPFADRHETIDRNVMPFTGQPPPGPSTYTRNDGFTPDNPYRYGQYEGEKMFFDNPGLQRNPDGSIPDLPEARPGRSGGGSTRERLMRRLFGMEEGDAYAGGGLLKGPGDGQSDNIPAEGPGKQPILLSDGEFVISADVVAALGAGSTEAGAKRLHSAMDKIRTQSYGSAKQARRPGKITL
jgi:hypothetical protein